MARRGRLLKAKLRKIFILVTLFSVLSVNLNVILGRFVYRQIEYIQTDEDGAVVRIKRSPSTLVDYVFLLGVLCIDVGVMGLMYRQRQKRRAISN